MSTLRLEIKDLRAMSVRVHADSLTVELSDGRSLSVPLAWFPRLQAGTQRERSNWRLVGGGEGIHWSDLDEDVSVEALLAGRASMESRSSFAAWLQARRKRLSQRSAKRFSAAGSRRRGKGRA